MASSSVRVVINHAGMDELLSAPGVVAELASRAGAAAQIARADAPVKTGAYRDSIAVTQTTASAVGMHFRYSPGRPAFTVGASVPYAMAVEARTGNLARTLGTGRFSVVVARKPK